MSNTLKITTAFSANAYDTVISNTVFGNGSVGVGLTGSVNSGVSQSIATNWVRITTGSVSPMRYMYLENFETASTYTIDVGILSASVTCSVMTLRAGDFAVLPPNANAVFIAKSNLSASVMQISTAPF